MEIPAIGVHPAYFRQGHGERLMEWCLALADLDKVPTCVSGSPLGAKLFAHLGFKEAETIEIGGYEQHPHPIRLCLALRKAKGPKGSSM